MNRLTKEIARIGLSGVLMALSILLSRFVSFYLPLGGFPTMKIGFGTIPIILASLICGPFWGVAVGAGADYIGATLFPIGPYFYGYTIDSALVGLIPWALMALLKKHSWIQLAFDGSIYGLSFLAMALYVFLSDAYGNGKPNGKYHVAFTPGVRAAVLGIMILGIAISLALDWQAYKASQKSQPAPRFEQRKLGSGIEGSQRPKGGLGLSFLDSLTIALASNFFVIVLLASFWTSQYYGLPYGYNLFNATIAMFVSVPIKALVLYGVMVPLTRSGALSVFQWDDSRHRYQSAKKALYQAK